MGTASSIVAGKVTEEDDEFGDDTGVFKKIPDERPPRKTLSTSLRSVGSFGIRKSRISSTKGKPVTKSSSLRSALSLELETEAEKIRRDYEIFRLRKQTEIAELKVRTEKLLSENQRFRGEIKALQSTCLKLRNEKSIALDGKEQALQRAAAIEKERDKVQRQFKIFRETKEREVQDLLQAKKELEGHIQYYKTLGSQEDRTDAIGNVSGDLWASSLESDTSVDSMTQLTSFRGPEFFHSPVEKDGPFTNISRDDWNAVVPSVVQLMSSSLQAPVQQAVMRVYVSAPSGMQQEVNLLKQLYIPELEWLCENQGKFLVVVHFDDAEEFSNEAFAVRVEMRSSQLKQSKVFIAFLGGKSDRFTYEEYHQAHLSNPGNCHSIFCFKDPDWDSNPCLKDENIHLAEQLKTEVRRTENMKLFDNYETGEKGAEIAYEELRTFLLKELGISGELSPSESICPVSDECFWDVTDDWDQVEALKFAAQSSCEVGLSKCYSDLNEHVSSSGPLPPMVVIGAAGSGKSFLLAKWIALQQSSLSGRLVLYHFVGSMSSSSASPVLMLRRFTIQLMKQVMSSSTASCDPAQLGEEFPRWLEKAASKVHGGVTLVIDGADKLQGVPSHMQWLLDPLPVGARVILSVTESSCPLAWRSWPSLRLSPLGFKESVEMMVSSLNQQQINITQEQVEKMLYGSSSEAIHNPRFISLLASEMNGCKDTKTVFDNCLLCLSKKNTVDLLCYIINMLEKQFRQAVASGTLRQVLLCMLISRNGVSESELLYLVPMKWFDWIPLSRTLHQRQLIVTRRGLMLLANEDVREAVNQTFSLQEDLEEVKEAEGHFVKIFDRKLREGHVSWRVTDELPWSLKKACKKKPLEECLLNANVFKVIFERGRIYELINYWFYIGVDQASLGKKYLDVIKKMENEDEMSASTAEMFEVVGRFLKCLGLLSQAAPVLQQSLEIRETVLDPDHPLVAQSLHHLAGLFAQWGKFSAAEAFYKHAIEIKENTLGPNHPSLVKDLEGLVILYKRHDKHSMAESLRKKAEGIKQKANSSLGFLDLKKKTLHVEELARGPPNTEVARSLNELGVLYFLQNNHEASRSFFERSLEMREALQGPDHPDVAQSLHNLAAFYNDQKLYEKAEPLYEKAYQIRIKAFPPHDASVASTIKHLAVLYRKQGKYAEAEPLYRQALEIREKSFGNSHPSVATALNNLAVVLCLQGRQSEALPLYERALHIYEDTLGGQHPRVAETLVNLAKLSYDLGSPEKAAQLYKRANDIKEREHQSGAHRRRSSFGVLSNGTAYVSSVKQNSLVPEVLDSVSGVLAV